METNEFSSSSVAETHFHNPSIISAYIKMQNPYPQIHTGNPTSDTPLLFIISCASLVGSP